MGLHNLQDKRWPQQKLKGMHGTIMTTFFVFVFGTNDNDHLKVGLAAMSANKFGLPLTTPPYRLLGTHPQNCSIKACCS